MEVDNVIIEASSHGLDQNRLENKILKLGFLQILVKIILIIIKQ